MKRHIIYIYALAALLLASCTGGRRSDMLTQLEELERQNRADSLMTNDSLALALADFFDRHGTPNEQLRAHYILGRTYADLGEAPAAIEAYLDAASRADTTASDCDYHTLSRVYGWISDIMYKQNLMKDYIENIDRSVQYAWKAGDTIQALTQKARKVMAYIKMEKPDSVVIMFDEVFNEMVRYLGIETASKYSLIPVNTLLKLNELEKAKTLIHYYEHFSGYFDSVGNVQRGREQYYYYKGYYYMFRQQLDSAEYFFRKELQHGRGFFEQNTGANGLADLFRQQQRYDSATKYALYSYSMNDSVYAHKVTEEVERATALFNYTRYQQKALHEQENAAREKARRTSLGYLLLLIVAVFAIAVMAWRKKRRESLSTIRAAMLELGEVQHDLRQLQTQQEAYQELISEKTETINRLESDLASMQEQESVVAAKEQMIKQKNLELVDLRTKNEQLNQQIENKEAYSHQLRKDLETLPMKGILKEIELKHSLAESGLIPLLKRNRALTPREWINISNIVSDKLPEFSQLLLSKQEILDEDERKLCILFRLHCPQKVICILMDIKQPSVSKQAGRVMMKLFNGNGGSKMLQQHLEQFC